MLKISESLWDHLLTIYGRGNCPNKSNSDYEANLVNAYFAWDETLEVKDFEREVENFKKNIGKYLSAFNIVDDTSFDVDEDNRLLFVDITVNSKTIGSQLEELLKGLNKENWTMLFTL